MLITMHSEESKETIVGYILMLTDKLPVQTGAKKHEMTRTGIFTGLRVLLKICSHVAAHADILKLQKPTHAQPKLEAALSFTSQLNHSSGLMLLFAQ